MHSGFSYTARFSKFPYLGMKLGHWPKCQKLKYTLFLPYGVEIELIFALWAAVSERRADFQNCHIWAWNLAIGQRSSSWTYKNYSLFIPGGQNWVFCSGLRYGSIFKIVIFGHKTVSLTKDPEVAHIHSCYPRGSKSSLFSLYGQRFPKYGPIFKIAIFGHETWALAKVSEVVYVLFLPHRVKIIFAPGAAVSEILADFQNCHIWAWNLASGQSSTRCIYSFPTLGGSKLSSFLLYGQRFPRYGPIFKIAIFGHETWQVAKVPEVAHMLSFYPRGSKLSLFLLYGQRFPRY